jgi:hypothetical protein
MFILSIRGEFLWAQNSLRITFLKDYWASSNGAIRRLDYIIARIKPALT